MLPLALLALPFAPLPFIDAVPPVTRCAVIGDYGVSGTSQARVSALVHGWAPQFVITTGDNNYPDGAASTIDANIGQYWHDFIAPYNGSYGPGSAQNRFFPSLGNHDWVTPNAQPYLNFFTLPGNERYYSFVSGPVRFWSIDSDVNEPHGNTHASTQAQWLRAGLASATEPFQLVYFHHAALSSGDHGVTTQMQWPFREWGADLVLAGHDHHYERIARAGFPYVVSGNGGAGLYAIGTPIEGSQRRFNQDHGALLLEAWPDRLLLRSISAGGYVQDTLHLGAAAHAGYARYVTAGATWRYRDTGQNLGSAWRALGYDDSAWAQGAAHIGYGDGDETTGVSWGPSASSKYRTTYFRRAFQCADPAQITGLELEMLRDDGAVVYLNGVEIVRTNLPAGAITSSTFASAAVADDEEHQWFHFALPASGLVAGANVLAVELHQVSASSSDLSLDLRLSGRLRGTLLVPRGAVWRYLDSGRRAPRNWARAGCDASQWGLGTAPLGYGGDGEATRIDPGPNPAQRAITTWMRHEFTVPIGATTTTLGLAFAADDGLAVHLNGVEVLRHNLPTGPLGAATTTELAIGGADEGAWIETLLDPASLIPGRNLIAVELHQRSSADDDAHFDLELTAW